MSIFLSVHTLKNLRVFTVICGEEPFSKCDVRCREHMSSFGKVHSASSPFLPCFLCNDMQEPGLMLGTHVLWICYISFMLFVVKSSKHFLCLRWSVQSIFFLLPPVIVCVLRCECEFYFFCSLNLISSSSTSTLSSSVFYFSTCN